MSSRTVLVALALTLLGCGSRVTPNASKGDASSPDGALTGDIDPRCPASPPALGGACSPEELLCEWGDDERYTCNTVSRCYSGKWELFTPNPTKCPSTKYGLPSACPTYAVASASGRCSDLGLFCSYPDGLCTCMTVSGPPLPDAGTYPPTWVCGKVGAGCPRPRPRVGSPCSSPDLLCDYGVCNRVEGSAFRCDGATGRWAEGLSVPCGGA